MSHPWRHAACESCYWETHEREPVRLKNPEEEVCCYCGETTKSGIYTRGDPKKTRCKGEGVSHE